MTNVFVDTGALIALILEMDPSHEKAVHFFQEAHNVPYKLFTCDYVLDEFLTWARCKRKHDVGKLVSFISGIHAGDVQIVGITQDLFGDALKIMKKYKDHYFSFTDCVSFAVMKEMNIKNVATTDKHFAIAGFNNLLKL